ncbi:MAG TPA: DUF4369 domain-containing protein, partial [Chitinophagaceae bacterium]|nr:DUF4369 domain-containing protein [Chitinophagaceae bacterium]
MKKLNISIFLLLACLFLHRAHAQDGMALVSGTINKGTTRTVILFEVIEGKKAEYASIKLSDDNRFAFALPSVKEGFYYISDQSKNNFTRVYLKRGDRLEVEINKDGYEVVKGSAENKLLHDWFAASYPVTYPAVNWMQDSSTYTTYFPKLETFVKQLPAFKSKVKTKNAQFNRLMNLAIDTDIEYAAMHFLLVPNTIHPKKEQYPAYYRQIIQPNKFTCADLLQLGEGIEAMTTYATFNMLMNGMDARPANRLQANANLIAN